MVTKPLTGTAELTNPRSSTANTHDFMSNLGGYPVGSGAYGVISNQDNNDSTMGHQKVSSAYSTTGELLMGKSMDARFHETAGSKAGPFGSSGKTNTMLRSPQL